MTKIKVLEDLKLSPQDIIADFTLAVISRETSLLGRKEVLTGKAKFGIFGDGKELPQIVWSKFFQKGDWRSGYYRDQTFMMALDELSVQEYFAGLYAHTDITKDPMSAGRQMGGHFATHSLNEKGEWNALKDQYNSSSDISPTAGQMPRLLGLALASKYFKSQKDAFKGSQLSNEGNEVAWGTIGDASTSEGLFWETMNAAGVMQVPMVMSVWDDGHGISVPKKYQTTKESISDALAGFQRTKDRTGFEILKTKAWDYIHMLETYQKANDIARKEHVPVLVHVEEVTQPQGHSTSGSHERYKSEDRLQWEQDFDCIQKLQDWIVEQGIEKEENLQELRKQAKKQVRADQKLAWSEFTADLNKDKDAALDLIKKVASTSPNKAFIKPIADQLSGTIDPIRKETLGAARKVLRITRNENSAERTALNNWVKLQLELNYGRYSDDLYADSGIAASAVTAVPATYPENAEKVDGRLVLRANFEKVFKNMPEVLTFGEDTGKIGGVNQSMEGMQELFGIDRVFDTGIREATIMGQGIGMAMRGLRPIAEIQYLDYLLYAIQIMSDDLATVRYRTKGKQKAPLIVRTRGHRLEGIWHSGSPMGMIINALRGMVVAVPRNMTQAAGMYNTLLASDDPALVIEPLNGYRIKEDLPQNIGEYKVAIGKVEVLNEGTDITILSYGSTFNLCQQALKELNELGISAELIDAQTLLPFDLDHQTVESLKKTNRLLIVDEDVSSGATAYLLDQILNKQGGYYHLDAEPMTLAAKDHRPAYGTDGDYFSKPSIDDIVEKVYDIMHESNPAKFPLS